MPDLTYALQQYKKGQRLSSSPRQILFAVYTEAISACIEQNTLNAIRALSALQLSLHANDISELTSYLNHIFEYCLLQVQKENFDHAAEPLIQLRSAFIS